MTHPLYAELLSVDAHGPLDIVSERAWFNVKLNQHQSQATVAAETQPVYLQGADLNCLLRGAFTLLGSGALLDTDLPGGVFPWEVVLGTIMATLRHLCSVDDVTRRIDHLLCSYLHRQQSAVPIAQSLLSRDNDNHSQHGRLLHGSFSFLCYWAHSFHGHLSDIDVFKLHHAVIRFSSQLPKRIQSESASHVEYDRISSRVVDCQLVMSSLLALRTNVSLGRHLTRTSNYWLPSGRTNNTPSGRTNNASSVCDEWLGGFHPDVEQLEGTWSGLDASGAGNQLKELLRQSAPIQIEIFGGDMILDEFSSDEDEQAVIATEAHPSPVVRLRPGYSLLRDPVSAAVDLFSVDPLELARQWTITDHALFAAIPLHSLTPTIDAGSTHSKSGGSSSAVYSQPRYQQMRRGVLGYGLCGGARTFIDRFNALSNWVAYSVLMLLPVDLRADRVAFFIKVASHLEELDNYNGLMIILTALNQGCITRLQHTFALLKPADHSVLNRLNKLMSGTKNYQTYRGHLKQAFTRTSSGSPVPVPLFLPSPLPSFRERGRTRQAVRTGQGEPPTQRAPIWKAEIFDRYAVSRSYEQQRLCEQVRTQRAQEQHYLLSDLSSPNQNSSNNNNNNSPQAAAAMVPHLGAHLSELSTIEEGNPDYLSDAPHLFNMDKCVLLAASLSSLSAMQQLPPYQLQPVRCLMAVLNYFARLHCRLSAADSAAYSKKLYNRSLAVEPTGASSTQVMQSRSKQAQWTPSSTARRDNPTVEGQSKRSPQLLYATRNNSRGTNDHGFTPRSVGDEEEDDDEDDDGYEEEEGDNPPGEQSGSAHRSLLLPFKKLMNKLTPSISYVGGGDSK